MEFLPSLATLSAFTVASLLLTITPGPDMTLFLSKALSQGRIAGLVTMFGAITGIVFHTLLAAFGISALIAASPTGFWILKVAGAIYLLWLGIQAIRNGSAVVFEEDEKPEDSLFRNWLTGLGINLLNPKIVIFFMTFLPQFVSLEDEQAAAKMIFLGFYFIFIATLFCGGLIVLIDKVADHLKKNPKVMRIFDYLFATVFGAFAVRILLTQSSGDPR